MKHFIWLALLILVGGCKKEAVEQDQDQSGIIGKWLRVEQYVSPGSGGSWMATPDNPPVTVEFTAAGKVISNHPFYTNYTDYRTAGTDSLELTNGSGNKRHTTYTLNNGKLTVYYTCIEGCGDRFTRK